MSSLDHPPQSVASPSQIRPRNPADVRWYMPTWRERIELMGWRNVLWLGPIAMTVLILFSIIVGWLRFAFFWGLWKLLVIAFGAPLAGARKAAKQSLEQRTDPFCIHCGYSLAGLEDGHICPECGEITNHAVCREYQRDPHAFIERYKVRDTLQSPSAPAAFEAGANRVESTDGT